jgi:hypothetical protein
VNAPARERHFRRIDVEEINRLFLGQAGLRGDGPNQRSAYVPVTAAVARRQKRKAPF